jgi:ribosomal protein L7Ae-like RNA K-turn-binding protein
MNGTRVFSMLSLCAKAGKIQTGETAAEKLLRSGEAELIIVAGDASENTRNKFINKCFYYRKPVLLYGEREGLSRSVGKQNRTVYAVTDARFAQQLKELIEKEGTL